MDRILVWVFGILGLLITLVGGFLWLKDGGLAGELAARDKGLLATPDAGVILTTWGESVDRLANTPKAPAASKGKDGMYEAVKQAVVESLPEPKEALGAAREKASELQK